MTKKQRIKIAKIHEKIANKRRDFFTKLSTEIIKNHDIICIEDLSSQNLMKNHKLAKAIGDVSWPEFVRLLEYKADWYDKQVSKISRWYPSSQICSDCGFASGKKHFTSENGHVTIVVATTVETSTLVSIFSMKDYV